MKLAARARTILANKNLLRLAVLPLFGALALGSASPKKDGAAADDKSSITSTTSATIGTPVAVGDAEWTVLDVVNRGTTMKASDGFRKDLVTSGTYIQVHFKVANKGKKEGLMGDSPKLVDGTAREFGTVDSAYAYRPKGTDGVVLDKINPAMSKEFTEIFEVPAGVTTASMKVHDFGIFGKDKTIALGTLPAAPPAVVAAAPVAAAKP
ncbi:MAG: hypothetical protein JWP97_4300, partial [Labilithrix sp.]|nr:hypothetical protein [Labilithrix sp.]